MTIVFSTHPLISKKKKKKQNPEGSLFILVKSDVEKKSCPLNERGLRRQPTHSQRMFDITLDSPLLMVQLAHISYVEPTVYCILTIEREERTGCGQNPEEKKTSLQQWAVLTDNSPHRSRPMQVKRAVRGSTVCSQLLLDFAFPSRAVYPLLLTHQPQVCPPSSSHVLS